MTLKLAVIGSRSITERETFTAVLERAPWIPSNIRTLTPVDIDLEVVTGGADGVDTMAEEWADEQGFSQTVFAPDWRDWSDGHPAKVRNTQIIEYADVVVAIWNGESPGTRDSIDKTLDRGKPIYVEVVE
jgi:hypothetical protein